MVWRCIQRNWGNRCRTIHLGQKFKAKGKRISTFEVVSIEELEPLRFPEKEDDDDDNDNGENDNDADEENSDPDEGKSESQVIDEITGQLNLFPDDENN